MSLFIFVMMAFANWRLAHFMAREDGPWDVMLHLRFTAGTRFDEYNEPYGTNTLSKALLCVWCNSFWIGVAQALYAFFLPEIALWVFLPFALSGFTVFVESIIGE